MNPNQRVSECTRKRRYRSQTKARAVAALRQQDGAPKLRAYHCPMCTGWHLTSKPAPELEPEVTPEGDEGLMLHLGTHCWALDLAGLAWWGEVVEISKKGGAARVRFECPAGELFRWFKRADGMPGTPEDRGWRVVTQLPEGEDRPVLLSELRARITVLEYALGEEVTRE